MFALLPGLSLTLLVVLAAMGLTHYNIGTAFGFSTMTFAIILGMIVGNTFYEKIADHTGHGVSFAKGQLLRLGIILYGFRLTLTQVVDLGWETFVIDVFMIVSTFLVTYWVGCKYLKMDKNTVVLTGAGCSICGAAAVMATSSLIKAKASEITQAIAVVVLFGTIAIFLYPWLYAWFFTPEKMVDFGIVVGASVHEVAQVVAVGKQISNGTMDLAVMAKMVRVMMLAPFMIILLLFLSKGQSSSAEGSQKIVIPWFAVLFLVMIVVNSFVDLPPLAVETITSIDTFLLTMAMAGLGLTTHLSAFRFAGPKALILGLIVFIWLIFAGLASYFLLF